MIWFITKLTITSAMTLFLLYSISEEQVLQAMYAGFALFVWLGITIAWKDSSVFDGNSANQRRAATVRAMKKDGTFIELPGKRGVIDTLATYRGLVADGKSTDEADAIVSGIVREMSVKDARNKSRVSKSSVVTKSLVSDMHRPGNASHNLR